LSGAAHPADSGRGVLHRKMRAPQVRASLSREDAIVTREARREHGTVTAVRFNASARLKSGRITHFMWKIERAVEGDAVVFKVSGRMQGELLAELEKAFAAETKTPAVAVDLQNVRLADQETVRFLAMYEAQGVRLLNCPGYVREWITRVRTNTEAT
jgi:hypothetical protein